MMETDNMRKESDSGFFAFLVESKGSGSSLISKANKISKGGNFLLVIKNIKGIEKRFIPAYINAVVRREEGVAAAKSLQMEILLFIAGTMQVNDAIRSVSGSGSRIILFSNSKKILNQAISKFNLNIIKEYSLLLDPSVSIDVAATTIRHDKK
jgi:tRNA threonylcarbamoyladenosine modification (KEOPS) complex Cgi121 subunit